MTAGTKTVKLRGKNGVLDTLAIGLPELRRLIELDRSFPPVEWTGPRSGFVFREDLERWIRERHDRDARRRQQQRRKREFVAGRRPTNGDLSPRPLPDFLRS